jgi:pilus assembly protein Flp/PilA
LFSVFFNAGEISPALDCSAAPGARESRHCRRQEFLMRALISKFLADQSGATAIEYCMIAAGISIVIVVVVNGIGSQLSTKYTAVNTALQ